MSISSGMDWWLILLLLIPFLAYAEIHLTGGLWKGRLHQKAPEVLADLPWRIEWHHPLPVFIFIKDAHWYPIILEEVRVEIRSPVDGNRQKFAYHFASTVEEPLAVRQLQVPAEVFTTPGRYQIHLWIRYRQGNRTFTVYQDNYRHTHKPAFFVDVDAHPLPAASHWYWGDLHTHSAYTNDPIEFGAPLGVLAQAASAMGLHFVAVTDHSYDFPGNSLPDAPPEKWHHFLQEVAAINQANTGALLIPGEEVSVENSKGAIIHALVLGSTQFFPGNRDGAIRLGNGGFALTLAELAREVQHHNGLLVAAHPFEVPPASQRILLRRGFWYVTDLHRFGVNHWQIHNGLTNPAFHLGVQHWILSLLNGQRIGILAGTDAHGNFNLNRHVAIPLVRLHYTRQQLLGQARTAVHVNEPPTPENVLNAVAHHRTIISTGPFCTIQLSGPNLNATIGDTCPREAARQLTVIATSTPQWGTIKQLTLFWGTRNGNTEQRRSIPIGRGTEYYFAVEEPLPNPDSITYIRAQLFTERDTDVYFCLTNPIWFQ